jgi:hypothetical protein
MIRLFLCPHECPHGDGLTAALVESTRLAATRQLPTMTPPRLVRTRTSSKAFEWLFFRVFVVQLSVLDHCAEQEHDLTGRLKKK